MRASLRQDELVLRGETQPIDVITMANRDFACTSKDVSAVDSVVIHSNIPVSSWGFAVFIFLCDSIHLEISQYFCFDFLVWNAFNL